MGNPYFFNKSIIWNHFWCVIVKIASKRDFPEIGWGGGHELWLEGKGERAKKGKRMAAKGYSSPRGISYSSPKNTKNK